MFTVNSGWETFLSITDVLDHKVLENPMICMIKKKCQFRIPTIPRTERSPARRRRGRSLPPEHGRPRPLRRAGGAVRAAGPPSASSASDSIGSRHRTGRPTSEPVPDVRKRTSAFCPYTNSNAVTASPAPAPSFLSFLLCGEFRSLG